jgi:hypothetical protein
LERGNFDGRSRYAEEYVLKPPARQWKYPKIKMLFMFGVAGEPQIWAGDLKGICAFCEGAVALGDPRFSSTGSEASVFSRCYKLTVL